MQLHHLQHLARAASGLTISQQIIISGSAALFLHFDQSSEMLTDRFEQIDIAQIIVTDNDDPEAKVRLLEATLGRESAFYKQYGYGIEPILSWDAILPSAWVRRLFAVNQNLRHNPSILTVSPTDVILGDMIQSPIKSISLELVKNGLVETREMRQRTSNWTNLTASDRMSIYSQIQELDELAREQDEKSVFLPFIEPFNTTTYSSSGSENSKILPFHRPRAQSLRS